MLLEKSNRDKLSLRPLETGDGPRRAPMGAALCMSMSIMSPSEAVLGAQRARAPVGGHDG